MTSRKILLFILLVSCGSFHKKSGKNPQDVSTAALQTERIDEILQEIRKTSSEFPCSRTEGCRFVDLTPEKNVEAQKDAAVVMVIDKGMIGTSLSAFRNRVIAHYDGYGNPYSPRVRVPEKYYEIMKIAGNNIKYIPYEKKISDELARIGHELMGFMAGPVKHGDAIFNFLAQADKNAFFVIVQENEMDICGFFVEAESSKDGIFAERLTGIIERHGVKYINLSSGFDIPSFKNRWIQKKCRGTVPDEIELVRYMKNYNEKFIQKLSEYALVVKAGPNIDDGMKLKKHDADYFSDCSLRGNIIRVQPIVIDDNLEIPAGGIRQSMARSHFVENSRECTDLYVRSYSNFNDPRAMLFSPNMLMFLNMGISTSYMAPVALSYLAQIGEYRGLDREAAASLVHGQSEDALIIDPKYLMDSLQSPGSN
ncbi:MAG: hypothetical protein HQK54_04050 [Oligoflexales bacterium]|nr:hypothetical protein [Oligoflexales bacterium]